MTFHEGDQVFLDTARTNGWQAFLCDIDGDAHRCVASREGEVVFLTTGWEGPGHVTAERRHNGRHQWVDPGRVCDLLRSAP